ncbi:hypothetical protein R1flu_004662 [Riccia fluitans]|uniref:Uncharacterized protein n=1 Tax=Riccia fluitans TaxID=41844 RepID=A0ABD1YQY4_9MARC
MTIVHLFRKYKRWNPVHPTFGAFWGVGIGLGCGVGWGPGFGPEAVGFVGSGCGVGFSVGVTLIGVGVGLPASGLTCLPYDTLTWTGRGASNLTFNYAIPALALSLKQCGETLALQSASLGQGFQRFCASEIPKGKKLISQLQTRVIKGLLDKSDLPSTERKHGKDQHRTGNVHFSKSYKWIKDPPSDISPPSSTLPFELDSIEGTPTRLYRFPCEAPSRGENLFPANSGPYTRGFSALNSRTVHSV